MTVGLLKIFAVIFMICDHIRYITPSLNTELTRFLGRVAFPIFAFFVAEGCTHTKDIKKYLKRLIIFALISQIPFMLFVYGCNIYEFDFNHIYSSLQLNVIFTLLLGAISIIAFDKTKNIILKFIIPVCIAVIAQLLHTDYGALGVVIIFVFYILKDKLILKNILVSLIFIIELLIKTELNINSIIYCMPFFGGFIFAGILLSFYNGEKGKLRLKYFFYLFYPIHMIVIYFLYNLVN